MEIKEFEFRKDNRVITVPFPARPIHSVKCTECGFDGLASQLVRTHMRNVKCPVCGLEQHYANPIYYANGDNIDDDQ
jgi:hypothetical protein